LKDVFYRLEKNAKEFNDEKINQIVVQFKEQIPQVIKEKNVKLAIELIDNLRSLDWAVMEQIHGVKIEISLIYNFHEDFDMLDWSNRNKARQLINQGMQIANDNPTKQKLRPIVIELYKLLPDSQKPITSGDDGSHVIG
jgi:molecular chaperone DnaK